MASEVRNVLGSVRSLLGGGSAFLAGNALLGVVLPLRMEAAGYPVALTGMIMAAYYLGLALGGLRAKRVILRIGHIRAFAVFAALAAGDDARIRSSVRPRGLAGIEGRQRLLHCGPDDGGRELA